MKKFLTLALLGALLALVLAGCGAGGEGSGPTKLSFADSTSMDKIRALDGKQVTITGYMATLSPLSGAYIYLMNMPYQSCPFCVPNTTQLSNTMAVYAASGQKFDFTDRPVKITGTMKIGDMVDEYGYSYDYRIVDAQYETVDLSSISEDYALYQSLAEDGVISDVNAMFDYLMFVCQWTEYQGSYVDEEGNQVVYYLYPGDMRRTLESDGAYGYKAQTQEDYFPSLIKRVQAVDGKRLADLTAIISSSQTVEKYALAEFDAGNYTYDEQADKYILDNDAELTSRFQSVYQSFSQWLSNYEL